MSTGRYRAFRTTALSVVAAFWLGIMAPSAQVPTQRGTDLPGAGLAQQGPAGPGTLSAEALSQISALLEEKANRTPAQRKLDSQLVYAAKMARGEAIAAGVTSLAVDVTRDATDAGLIVDVRATVSDALLQSLAGLGADVILSEPDYGTVRLRTTIDRVEAIAALPDVTYVQPKQEAMTSRRHAVARPHVRADSASRRAAFRDTLERALAAQQSPGTNVIVSPGQGSKSSQGDSAHRAFAARGTFHADGTGVKIGVLSDGVTSLAASQAAGDLGPVTVLPGQTGTGDEGTAMLEIVHDLAPGAQLYFATAFTSITSFAQNIRDLQAAGCQVIVDDVFYYVESPFQDGQAPGVISPTNAGVVSQAVKDVAALGVMYFSSASNSGNKDAGTSGTWEGDFVDGGAATGPLAGGGNVHNFGGSLFNTVTAVGNLNNLYWSDPLGASANDYDLFRLNSTGTTILAASTSVQNGTQDPYEAVTPGTTNERLVIVKFFGNARFLHLGTNRGRLSISTAGETHGHADTSATLSFSVAAVDASSAYPNPFNSGNVVETFSSDGPRRIFFTGAGSALTPGNFSSTGGVVLDKPDLTAADGVSVTGAGGFSNPFFGTSAAAPHAAAIAALIKSANPSLLATQIRTAMLNSALDIQAPGIDRNSGVGILQAYQAMQAAGIAGTAYLAANTTAAENPGNGDGVIIKGEGGKLTATIGNLGVTNATGIIATLSTSTTGVVITQPATRSFANIAAGAEASNAADPWTFTLTSAATCPMSVDFVITVTNATGGGSPSITANRVTSSFTLNVSTSLDGTPPISTPGVTTSTGAQTGRINRDAVRSSCIAQKATPTLFSAVGSRQSDSYLFNTCSYASASCVEVSLSGAAAANMFSVAYVPTYDRAAPLTNYKSDPGSSNNAVQYSFTAPAGAGSVGVVVHEVNTGGGIGGAYTLTVSGICGGSCGAINQLPVAAAHNVYVTTGGGSASASINNGSFDPDGDALTITQSPPGPYALGVTPVILTVTDTKGATSQLTRNVTVTTSTFTDNPVVAGLTIVRAAHILELRSRIDALRIARGMGGFAWGATLTAGSSVIQAAHITSLRTALTSVYTFDSLTAPSFDTDPSLSTGTPVRAAHIAEIRAALLAIGG